MSKGSNLSTEAVKLVNGARQESYGHPYYDFSRSTGAMSALGFRFQCEDGTIRHLGPSDLPIMMLCVKAAREVHKHKEDNLVDIIGYTNCLGMVLEKQHELVREALSEVERVETAK